MASCKAETNLQQHDTTERELMRVGLPLVQRINDTFVNVPPALNCHGLLEAGCSGRLQLFLGGELF
jgi:hypothetical protein